MTAVTAAALLGQAVLIVWLSRLVRGLLQQRDELRAEGLEMQLDHDNAIRAYAEAAAKRHWCACGTHIAPEGFLIRDDTGAHEAHRCQPEREALW